MKRRPIPTCDYCAQALLVLPFWEGPVNGRGHVQLCTLECALAWLLDVQAGRRKWRPEV